MVTRVVAVLGATVAAVVVALLVWLLASGQGDWGDIGRGAYLLALLAGVLPGLFAIARRSGKRTASTLVETEVPLGPEVRAFIAARRRSVRRGTLVACAGIAGILLVIGGLVLMASGDPTAMGIFTVLAVVLALIFFAALWPTDRRLSRDEREASFLRASGPTEVVGSGAYFRLYVGDRSLPLDAGDAPKIPRLPEATVDYLRHARLVLEVRDPQGTPVFRAREYAGSSQGMVDALITHRA